MSSDRVKRCSTCSSVYGRGDVSNWPKVGLRDYVAPMSVRDRIGTRPRELRASRTQREIATIAGVTSAWISELERGTRPPTLDSLDAIAGALGARVEIVTEDNFPRDGEERALLELWRGLDADGQVAMRDVGRRWMRLSLDDRRTLRGLMSLWSQSLSTGVDEGLARDTG